jgi:hypothetical protein
MISTAIIAILSATRGKVDDRLAELLALLRIGQRLLHRRLRHADRARRGLDARRFEGLHQLPEAEPSTPPSRFSALPRSRRRRSRILHAAIAEHLDLGARHAGAGKRISSVPRGFSASSIDSPRWPGSFGLVRTSKRHQVGAHGMRDPGLVAVDLVDVALAHARVLSDARSEPVLGSVNTRSQHLAANASFGNHLRFCPRLPAPMISSAAISEARAERADPDIAAGEFLRHDAHDSLPSPRPPYSSGMVRPNTPRSAHLRQTSGM